MNHRLLSIIIPVYNVERWLDRCLTSILEQHISWDICEIILVDDGSKDSSAEICDRYAAKYSNIRVIHQQNQGLSQARNNGMAEATGEYVWFIDSDDWICPDTLGRLIELVGKKQTDVLCFSLQLVDELNKVIPFPIQIPDRYDGARISGRDFVLSVSMPPAAWLALYRRQFLIDSKLIFLKGVLHEDMEFTTRAYALAGKIAYYPIVVYNYFQRAGSIMNSNQSAKRAVDLLKIADSLNDFRQQHFAEDSQMNGFLNDRIAFVVSQSMAFYHPSYFPISRYREKSYFPLRFSRHLPFAVRLKYQLINKVPSIYWRLNRLGKCLK